MSSLKTSITYYQDEDEANTIYIEDLYVAEEERGKGKGRSLLQEAYRYASDNNYSHISILPMPTEEDGITESDLRAFYRSFGFSSTEGELMIMSV